MPREEFRRKSKRRGYLEDLMAKSREASSGENTKPAAPSGSDSENYVLAEEKPMALTGGYTDPAAAEGSGKPILPVREHAAVLTSLALVENDPHPDSKEARLGVKVQQFKWTFEGLKWKDPETGEHGVISLWTGLNYGNPKAKLTPFVDTLFGRPLTATEARKLDYEKLVGKVKGFVQVVPHKKQDGSMTAKFGGFRWPDNMTPPDPADFFADEEARPPMARNTPPPSEEMESDDDGDPFADEA